MSGWEVLAAGDLTPRHIGRLARTAAGGPFRRLRYFLASTPAQGMVVVTLRFDDEAENQESVSVSLEQRLQVIERDEFTPPRMVELPSHWFGQ